MRSDDSLAGYPVMMQPSKTERAAEAVRLLTSIRTNDAELWLKIVEFAKAENEFVKGESNGERSLPENPTGAEILEQGQQD